MSFFLWSLSIAGWALVLTKGEGPFRMLARLRAIWTNGPLRCPMCVGTWLGFWTGLAWCFSERFPAIVPILNVFHCAGAGAAVAWLFYHSTELARRGADVAAHGAWLLEQVGTEYERGGKSYPEEPAPSSPEPGS